MDDPEPNGIAQTDTPSDNPEDNSSNRPQGRVRAHGEDRDCLNGDVRTINLRLVLPGATQSMEVVVRCVEVRYVSEGSFFIRSIVKWNTSCDQGSPVIRYI